jgi:hypothetical protein
MVVFSAPIPTPSWLPYNTEVKQITPMLILKVQDVTQSKYGAKKYFVTTWKLLGFIPVYTTKELLSYS